MRRRSAASASPDGDRIANSPAVPSGGDPSPSSTETSIASDSGIGATPPPTTPDLSPSRRFPSSGAPVDVLLTLSERSESVIFCAAFSAFFTTFFTSFLTSRSAPVLGAAPASTPSVTVLSSPPFFRDLRRRTECFLNASWIIPAATASLRSVLVPPPSMNSASVSTSVCEVTASVAVTSVSVARRSERIGTAFTWSRCARPVRLAVGPAPGLTPSGVIPAPDISGVVRP
mmetsp:Transcript_14248/g.60253  ORF Transcript_14248/g.60253 Transcript_14248/m.60253 type:complete len:230 (+) Transcript_14248:159-848(+)